LFGDGDGDKDVDGVDYNAFRSTYRKTTGMDGFLGWFDYDGDGDVDGVDNNEFLPRYRTRVEY
jgi:hypothetical protein